MLRFGCGTQDDPTTSKCNTTKLTIEAARNRWKSDRLIVISIGTGNPKTIRRPLVLREIAEMCLKIVDRNEVSAQIAHEKYPRAKNAMALAKWAANISPAVLSNNTYFAPAVIISVFHGMSVMVHAMSETPSLDKIIHDIKFLKTVDIASIVLLAEEALKFQSNGTIQAVPTGTNGYESLASAQSCFRSALADTRDISDALDTFTERLRALIELPSMDPSKLQDRKRLEDCIRLVRKVAHDAHAAYLAASEAVGADQSLSGNPVDALKKQSPPYDSKKDENYGLLVQEAAYLGFRVAKVNEKLPEAKDIIRGAVQAANTGGVRDPSDMITAYQHVSDAMRAIDVVSSPKQTSTKQITDILQEISSTAFDIKEGVSRVDPLAEAIVIVFSTYRKDFISVATKLASGAISEVSNAAPIQVHRFSPDITQVSLYKDGSEIGAADIEDDVKDYMKKEAMTRITLLSQKWPGESKFDYKKQLPVKHH